MIVRKNNNAIEIKFDYDPKLVFLVKQLDGRKYLPATKSWYIPLANSEASLNRLSERGFQIDPALWAEVKKDQEKAREAATIAKLPDTEFEIALPLFPYQKVGAAFLCKVGSGLLGDDLGLGKTLMSLAVAEHEKARKVLIFCPSAVKFQWAQEIEKFMPVEKERTCVIDGSKQERLALWNKGGNRFYIANYELLLRDFEEINWIKWDVIIADEATRISNPMAKQSKAIKKLRADRRIAMTGTPLSNRPDDVWSLIDFCQPGALGNYWNFMQRYCIKNQWGAIDDYMHLDELRDKLSRYMIRRLKKDVLPELPEKVVTDIPFELTEEEKELYRKLKKELLYEIEEEELAKVENPMTIQYTLVKMLRLRQLADSMELLGYKTKSSKLETLKELLSSAMTNGKKAIVFTQFAKMADILERELAEYGPLKISGGIKEEYTDVIARFNEEEEARLLIMTSAGQYGLNVQRASIVFHYDQEWSLAKMSQREGRAHRIGQKDTVLVYNLLARKTVDYYVKKILEGKAALAEEVLGDIPITMEDIKTILRADV